MLGRAGRPGKDKRGYGIIIAESRGQADEIKTRYFHEVKDTDSGAVSLEPKYEALYSALGNPLALQEQFLIALNILGRGTLESIEDTIFADSFLLHQGVRDNRSPMRLYQLGDVTAESSIEKHALADTVRAAKQGVLGTVRLRQVASSVVGGIVTEHAGKSATCRYSARTTKAGLIEGPMCSCGRPIDHYGILCHHLVTLGIAVSKEKKNVEGILVAPDFPKKVLSYLETNGLIAKKIPWDEVFPTIKRPKSALLEEFFEEKKK